MACREINAKGGVLGRKLELLPRDSKANADEAVRLARELIIKDNVDFLAGTLTSAEAPAVSTIAKENKIVFLAPIGEDGAADRAGKPASLYLPRRFQHRHRGQGGRVDHRRWKDVKRVATIAPDYAYGRDAMAAFVDLYQEGCGPTSRSSISNGRSSAEPISPPSSPRRWARSPDAVFCDVYRRRFRHLGEASGAARLFQGDQQPAGRRRRGRRDRRGRRRSATTIPTGSGPTPTIP